MATLTDIYPSYYNALTDPSVYYSQQLAVISKRAQELKNLIDKYKTISTEVQDVYKNKSIDYLSLIQVITSLGSLIPQIAPFVNKFIDFIWPEIEALTKDQEDFLKLKMRVF